MRTHPPIASVHFNALQLAYIYYSTLQFPYGKSFQFFELIIGPLFWELRGVSVLFSFFRGEFELY